MPKRDDLTTHTEWLQEFVSMACLDTRMVYVGIDPGAQGAIAFVQGRDHVAIDIPNMTVKKSNGGNKTVPNYQGILQVIQCLRPVRDRVSVCLEQPPPSMGPGKGSAYGQFMLGIHYGIWPLFLLSRGFWLNEVSPSSWKKDMKVSSDKEAARHQAMKMFPKAELCNIGHHNRAEALLLAEYQRRRENGTQANQE